LGNDKRFNAGKRRPNCPRRVATVEIPAVSGVFKRHYVTRNALASLPSAKALG